MLNHLPRAVLNLFETIDLNGDGSLSTADLPLSSRMVLDTGEKDFKLENCFCLVKLVQGAARAHLVEFLLWIALSMHACQKSNPP